MKRKTQILVSVFLSMLLCLSVSSAIAQTNPLVEKGYLKPFTSDDGKLINMVIVPGRPPAIKAEVVQVPDPRTSEAINVLLDVPALNWSYGCSATSAAMIAGHYDNTDYPNMYAGPTNSGVFPMNNSIWGSGECPLSATHMGYDGRATRGHVDDYWVAYGDTGQDPFMTNGWTEHTHGDCTADYMGTNQYNFNNSDGSTRFFHYNDGSPLYNYTGGEPENRDGCHGFRLFLESRGYTVNTNYTQLIHGWEGNTLGFTFDQFKAEIDAGRPVMIHVEGHTMVGYGYDDTGQIVYIHDTWDYSDHSMPWGGSYEGLAHYGVSVFELAPNSGENTPPEITGQVDLAATMETPLEITLSDLTVTDPDNVYPDDFTLFVMDGTDYARTGNTITPDPGFLGDLAVPVYVNDGTDDSNTYTLTVSVYTTLDPDLRVEPGTMPHVVVDYGMQDINTLTLYNDGGTELNFEVPYSLIQSEQTAAVDSSFSQSIPYMEIAKGQEDPRVGHKVTMGTGGPDAHGYIWIDSDEAGGPVFDWIDISSTGTPVAGLSDDNVVGPFPIGFDFPFYGEIQTEFYVQSNGLIAFEFINNALSNQPIPMIGDGIQNMIAWMWDDMHPMNGSVYYQIVDGVLVIQFDDYGECCTAGPTVDAEILLYPDGDIKVQYLNFLNGIDTDSCTIGIENADETDGLEVAFNTPYLHDGLAVLFATDAVTWLTASPKSGSIPPGGSQNITMTYNESSMDAGSYAADILITSDDPVDPEVLVPATMDVLTPPVMVVSPDSLEPMYLEPGYTVSKYLTISNEGSESTMEVGVRLSDISMIETSEPARLIPAESKSALTAQNPTSYTGKASYADKPETKEVKATDAPGVHRLSSDISGVPVLYITTNEAYETQFIGGLSSIGSIGTLDILDARIATPNLSYLLDYDLVIVTSDYGFADNALLGDNLADYVDSGGKVILFGATFYNNHAQLNGRITQPGYSPFPISDYGWYGVESDSFEDHYITNGISTLSTVLVANVYVLQGEGQSLGLLDSGQLLGAVNADESVAAINVLPSNDLWAGDLIELTDNAIEFMTEPWLGINPPYAIVPPGESVEIELRYSSVLLDEGLYSGRLVVTSNDPVNSPVEMSAFLGIYEFLDMDRDGLSDGWEMYYFGDLSQDGSGDFDGDGMTNAEEYEYGSDPTDIISFPQAEGILADFGGDPGYGLWTLDQSGWHSLNTSPFADATPADPFMMIAHDFDQDGRDEIATGVASGSTGGPGLYTWDDNAWTQDFTIVPENMVLFGNNLATDFGPDPFFGLWVYSGGGNWTNLNVDPFDAATNPADATLMEGADFDGDGQEELAMGISAGSFGGPGLYIWDENAWTLHFSIEPLTMMAFGNSLLTNYGGGNFFGLWRYDSTGWTNLNTTPFSDTSVANPDQFVAVDLDRDGVDELVASFPTGTTGGPGIYTWDDGWTQIFSVAAVDMIPLNDSVVFDFGPGAYYGIWRYSQSTGWTSLNTAPFTDIDPAVSSIMGSADLDRDGYAELVIGVTDGSTGGPGIYTWDGSWTLDLSIEPEDLESCFFLLTAP